jgi:hypothetical protein
MEAQCPYCGETVELTVEPYGVSHEHYVEDCSVCCQPWEVYVSRDDEGNVHVELHRGDE